jgi:hypothetical protein
MKIEDRRYGGGNGLMEEGIKDFVVREKLLLVVLEKKTIDVRERRQFDTCRAF